MEKYIAIHLYSKVSELGDTRSYEDNIQFEVPFNTNLSDIWVAARNAMFESFGHKNVTVWRIA